MFKKFAALCVTAYAKRTFNQAVSFANQCYEKKPDMYYVISDPAKPRNLLCINTAQFLELRHEYQVPSRALPISSIKKGCWYHTKSKARKDALTERELIIRKLAFVRELLFKAKLA